MAPKFNAERVWFVGFARSLSGRMDLALTMLLHLGFHRSLGP